MVVIALCIMLFINGIMGLHLYNNSYCFHLKKNHFYGLKSMTQCGDKLLDNPILPDSAMAELVLSNTFVLFKISKAPTEVVLALIFGQPYFGLVIIKFLNPKFFNDRADAPMFSPSCGLIKIKPYLFFMNICWCFFFK